MCTDISITLCGRPLPYLQFKQIKATILRENRPKHDSRMSSSFPPSKRARKSSSGRSGHSSKERDANQLTITSLLLRQTTTAKPAGARSSSAKEKSVKLNSSKDVIVIEDDVPARTVQAKDSDDCAQSQTSRDSSPELFADPTAGGDRDDVISDSGASGVRAEDGDRSNGGDTKEDAPDDQDLIESDQHKKEGPPLPDEVCYIEDDGETTPVRHKSPSTTSRSTTRSPEIDIPPWDGTPLSEIHFGPSTYPILPPLQSSAAHAVLFRPRLKSGEPPTPFPDKFKDIWDNNHVRMPCSSQSVYPVATTSSDDKIATKTLVSRWDIIKESLRKPIANSYDLEEAILTYNTHYAKRWNFYGLHSYFNDHCSEDEAQSFFNSMLPRVIDLALSLPSLVTHALPLLKKQLDYSISLSQQQVACLLANAFLCTFPRRNARGATSEYSNYPSINFNTLFSGSAKRGVSPVTANKLTCLFHYFTRYTCTWLCKISTILLFM